MSDPHPHTHDHPAPGGPSAEEHGLDAAQQSLSDALGVSFAVLKVLLVVLVVVYIFSGVFQVDEQNEAVRLRFGNTVMDENGNPIQYKPGWHLGLPFPLEEVIQVPVNEQRINIDTAFWYNVPEGQPDNPAALARQPLNPLTDGFLITGDANVVHLKFVVGYKVSDVNAYIQNVGDTERAEEIVRMAAERAVVIAMASADAKQIINRQFKVEVDAALRLARTVLTDLQTGIELQQILIDAPSPPVQIQASAYQLVSAAEQDRGTQIQNARQMAAETLNGVAGAAHRDLTAMIRAYEAASGADDQPLAGALRAELDRSLRELQMAGPTVDPLVQAYLASMTRTPDAMGDVADPDAALQAQRDQAEAELLAALQAMADAPREERIGRPIGGQIAGEINMARAYQSQVLAQLENEYTLFQAKLEQYGQTPLLVAHEYWQESRERILANGLIQTFYTETGDLRIITGGDPEVEQEIVEDMLEQRRREVEERSNARRGG